MKTSNDKIFVGSPLGISPGELFDSLERLRPVAEGNDTLELVQKLHELVPGYREGEAVAVYEESVAQL